MTLGARLASWQQPNLPLHVPCKRPEFCDQYSTAIALRAMPACLQLPSPCLTLTASICSSVMTRGGRSGSGKYL